MEFLIGRVKRDLEMEECKRKTLRELDLIVMDNSIRESTVGQLRGHTLENKWKIYDEIEQCGFQYRIVAAFSHMTRVDDTFIKELIDEAGNDRENFFAFTEAFENVNFKEIIPVGLKKMKTLGLINPIIEIDTLVHAENMTVENWMTLLKDRINWIKQNLSPDAKIMVNFRDFSDSMFKDITPNLQITFFLGSLPEEIRPWGILFEEPTGNYLPEELGKWCGAVRKMMDLSGWMDGHLVTHVHEKWGLAVTAQLECLEFGANGIWASVCEEGAALGHACSTVTMMNLVRMGNKKVIERYDCTYLRQAAMEVTKIVTGKGPHARMPIYGERALDLSFDFAGISGGIDGEMNKGHDINLAEFFNEDAPLRISTLSSERMIVERLKRLFGESEQFTEEIAFAMKKQMLADLTENRKEEYMSPFGLALLFDRSGGKLTPEMANIIAESHIDCEYCQAHIHHVREIWDEWDLQEEEQFQNDDKLQYQSFYNGFMAPYFGCFSCEDTRKGLKAIDMDEDGQVDWKEFLVYIKWAISEYQSFKDVDDLLSIVFRKGIIPAMKDEIVGRTMPKEKSKKKKKEREIKPEFQKPKFASEPEKERSYSKRLEMEKEAKKEMNTNTNKPLEKKTSAWKMIDGDWKDLSKIPEKKEKKVSRKESRISVRSGSVDKEGNTNTEKPLTKQTSAWKLIDGDWKDVSNLPEKKERKKSRKESRDSLRSGSLDKEINSHPEERITTNGRISPDSKSIINGGSSPDSGVESIEPVPFSVPVSGMGKFEEYYNDDCTDLIADLYAEKCYVTVNGGVDAGGPFTGKTNIEVAGFLHYLRNGMGLTNIKFNLSKVEGNFHYDKWVADGGFGSCKAQWEKIDGEWKMVSDEITFVPTTLEEESPDAVCEIDPDEEYFVQNIDPVPFDVPVTIMGKFEALYNADLTDFAGDLYSENCYVTVNGGIEAGGHFTGKTNKEVAKFLNALRNEMGGTNIKFNVTKVEDNFHYDTWIADNGTGTCKASWKKIDGQWKIISDEITFVPNIEPVPFDVPVTIMKKFEALYNANLPNFAAELYSKDCFVTVNGGVEAGGPFTGKTNREVAGFLFSLRNEMGGTNIKFEVTKVEDNVHYDTWIADNGTGTCKAAWKKIDGQWKIISDEITFEPNVEPVPFEVPIQIMSKFEALYNANLTDLVGDLYSKDCYVTVNGGVKAGGPFTGKNNKEVAEFLNTLRNEMGGTNIKFDVTKVKDNFHYDTWIADNGTGTCKAAWKKIHGHWKIISDEITFIPKAPEIESLPFEVPATIMKKFEEYYNADNTDLAGELYSDDCYVTVNGGVEAGGAFTGKTNKEVAGFLNALRNEMGGTNMKFTVTNVEENFHYDTWVADNGTGTCKAAWKKIDGQWKIISDEITFVPNSEPVPFEVPVLIMSKFEALYNADLTDLAGDLYSEDCYVTVNGGVEAGGHFTGKTAKEVAGFLNALRNDMGGTNIKFNVTKVEDNFHYDTWIADNGTGTCKAAWKKIHGHWKIISDEITFVPKAPEIESLPFEVPVTIMKKFEEYYNADKTDLAGELYSDDCFVTVNGGVEAGGAFTGKTNKEVAGFLNALRNEMGGTNMKFTVTKVEDNFHYDTWIADNGTGTCKAAWKKIDGQWKIISDDITFVPSNEPVPFEVPLSIMGKFEAFYNADLTELAADLYSEDCYVTVNGGVEAGGPFTGKSNKDVAGFLNALRNEMGGTNIKFNVTKVVDNFHYDSWIADNGTGTCKAAWKKIDGQWKIISDEITFVPLNVKDEAVPFEVPVSVMGKFEAYYNIDRTDLAGDLYAPTCYVTVNGGFEAGGPFTGKSNKEVASFLSNLRNQMGGTNLKFNVNKVDGNIHYDTWTADNGTGTCKATWKMIDSQWKIISDEITFIPKVEPVPFQVPVSIMGKFEGYYNADRADLAGSLYSSDCYVTVNGGKEAGGPFTGTTNIEVANFLNSLRNEMGCTNMKFNVTKVESNIHHDSWISDNGSGTCKAQWKKVDGEWKIVSDEITFVPKV